MRQYKVDNKKSLKFLKYFTEQKPTSVGPKNWDAI